MQCLKCGGGTSVNYTRVNKTGLVTRRRICNLCDYRFGTYEAELGRKLAFDKILANLQEKVKEVDAKIKSNVDANISQLKKLIESAKKDMED